ncbi:polysaccharide pyruvyl transferase family protein [Saccharomonospora sp. NPDC006951]
MTRRVGFFGLLGSGNIGNDGSFEAVLAHLRSGHDGVRVDAMCGGPEAVTARYGVPAVAMHWYRGETTTAKGAAAIAAKAAGKIADAVRTFNWVREHDVVIVPGMGVLEATLPLRPWGLPYSLLLLTASGRLTGTEIALVSVGADVVGRGPTRWLMTKAAKLAGYRSYRDELSCESMVDMGVPADGDRVYPDLAFALPNPVTRARRGSVGLGVIAYRGGNADRPYAEAIYRGYVTKLKRFVRGLLAEGRQVRLLTGDALDDEVVAELLADTGSPNLSAARVTSLPGLLRELATVETVVASRYHNVLCALKLGKPTVSIGYAAKNDVLMADAGLAGLCQRIQDLDLDRLTEQFREAEKRSQEIATSLNEWNAAQRERIDDQFAALSALIGQSGRPKEAAR